LSQTCRMVHDEVRDIFHSANLFTFEIIEWSEEKKVLNDPALEFLRCCHDFFATNLTIPPLSYCRISIKAAGSLKEDSNKYKFAETSCEWMSKAVRVRDLNIEYTPVRYWPEQDMSQIAEHQTELLNFTGLGLLGPFGKFLKVDVLTIQGDVPQAYKKDLVRKVQGSSPSTPLPDMYHALQRYVASFTLCDRADHFWLAKEALKFAVDNDMESFKRHRRKVKKLGDLHGLNHSALYNYDPPR